MKKTCRIIFIAILFIVLNIFQSNYKVYSYTVEEVKESISYTEVTEKPADYDVKIDAEDLIADEKFPYFQATIETVLYESEGLTDINFLTFNSTNTNSAWQVIQDGVVRIFWVSMYIAALAMITTLIYMAILLVIESYNPSKMPSGARLFRDSSGGNPEQELRRKALFDQWIIAIFLLGFITVIITLVVYFSDAFVSMISGNEVAEETYTVYVVEDSSGAGYTFETTLEGVLMFESQYDWSDYAAKNIAFIMSGIYITFFKFFLRIVYIIRMFVIAIVVAIAPLVVVVNAYLQISRKKGIFRKWLAIFLFCALIKTVIALVYYVLMANDFVLKFPMYVLVVITVEILATIISIMLFISSLRKVDKIEQQEYDEIHGNAPATTTRARMMQQPQAAQPKYSAIVKELRSACSDVTYMSNYLDSVYPEMQRAYGDSKELFVEKLNTEGGLSEDNGEKDQDVINNLKKEGKWKNEFNGYF